MDEAVRLATGDAASDVVMLIVNGLADAGTEKAVEGLMKMFASMPEELVASLSIGYSPFLG